MKKILFILLLATLGFAQVGIDYIPIWYGKKVIICPDSGLWSVDILPDDDNVRKIGGPSRTFLAIYVDTVSATYIKDSVIAEKYIAGNSTDGVWFDEDTVKLATIIGTNTTSPKLCFAGKNT